MAITKLIGSSLTNDTINATQLDETANYDFTGTVTGAGGITQADMWRLNANISIGAGVTTTMTGWVRPSEASQNGEYIGSGMSESSGIFTFPETGIYKVDLRAYYSSSNDTTYFISRIVGTVNDLNYHTISEQDTSLNVISGTNYTSANSFVYFDCQNTSTHKISFRGYSTHAGNIGGISYLNHTQVSFVRLGDT